MSILSAGSHGIQKRVVPSSLELELEVVMNHPMCALTTELESFGRIVQVAEPSPQAPRLPFLTILLSITKRTFKLHLLIY